MKNIKVIYVYDALCGWCYGFSPVIKAVYEKYSAQTDFEVISGGMITGERTGPIGVVAPYIKTAYRTVEETSGTTFGEAFLKVLERGELILDSEKPSIALSVFKSTHPEKAVLFAHALQNEFYFNGRDLNEEELYRYIAVNFGLDPDEFIYKMQLEQFKQDAYYDFALARQLEVNGYPSVLIQNSDTHFYLIARGYTDLETLELRIQNVLSEIRSA
ncbi:DsbA family protein [Rubrolithibacter danxiaensis]|uniref:DsbA family protein n=1 Tax=Rubrolithibacter danxiaensis TaxID=3390805 RepID=UPI003BF7BB04